MATVRGSGSSYSVGAIPPQISWTIVRGDTASFKVYVTDDAKVALDLSVWNIDMDIKRNGTLIFSLTPIHDVDDLPGEFTVSLSSTQSAQLETGDVFDIELSTDGDGLVWTVAQGKVVVIEDVTD